MTGAWSVLALLAISSISCYAEDPPPVETASPTEILSSEAKSPIIASSPPNVPSSSSVVKTEASSTVIYPTKPKTTMPPQIATSNLCDMSLESESEDKKKSLVKCQCGDVAVECSYLGITELPSAISFPKKVKLAKFQGNKIKDIKEDTFYNGVEILELDLSRNHIDFVSMESFQGFKSLLRLDLSHNKIWNVPIHAFQGLTHLRKLDLSFNDLINVFQGTFEHLADLRELDLQNNPIENLDPRIFVHLGKMEVLDLESTMLKVIPDHLFIFTPSLKALSLANNQLTDVPTQAFRVLDHVKILNINGNPIETIKPESFIGLTGLVVLYMDRMPELTRIEKHAFGDLVRLHEFHCSHNFKLSYIDELAFLKKVNQVKVTPTQLFLRQNDLFSLPPKLVSWSEEVELDVRENPWHCDCNVQWMKHMKLKNNFQEHIRCASPSHMEHHVMSNLEVTDLTCGMSLSDIVILTVGVLTAVLIILIIIAFIVWRRSYTGYVKPYYRVPKRKGVDDMECRGDDDDGI